MEEITILESTIFALLQEIEVEGIELAVYQDRPEILTSITCYTFNVSNNVPDTLLDKSLGADHIEVTIDIFASTTIEVGRMLKALESKMRDNNYTLVFNTNVPDPDMKVRHKTTKFIY